MKLCETVAQDQHYELELLIPYVCLTSLDSPFLYTIWELELTPKGPPSSDVL